MAQFVKRALAQAVKSLLRTKTLDKITVKDLVRICGINRQTFYYYFRDIYDLLNWIYQTEVMQTIHDRNTYDSWQMRMCTIVHYISHNSRMCVNIYRSLERERLEIFLYKMVSEHIGDIIDETAGTKALRPDKRLFLVQFYGYAFVGIIIEWIKSNMKKPANEIIDDVAALMDGTLKMAVKRFQDI